MAFFFLLLTFAIIRINHLTMGVFECVSVNATELVGVFTFCPGKLRPTDPGKPISPVLPGSPWFSYMSQIKVVDKENGSTAMMSHELLKT